MSCRRCGYRSCACGMAVKTREEIEAMTKTEPTAMSAPSKEEIARVVAYARDEVAVADSWRFIVALDDENERLRRNLEIAEQSRDAWKADRERVVEENATLRAERAECLALLTRAERFVEWVSDHGGDEIGYPAGGWIVDFRKMAKP